MVGDMLVFRQRGGKTIVSNAPKASDKPPTQQQETIRTRFQQAIIYGKQKDTIKVRVTDDFMVKNMQVKIENNGGSLLEEGGATIDTNGLDYIYTATKDNTDLAGDKITITATDEPDNVSFSSTNL